MSKDSSRIYLSSASALYIGETHDPLPHRHYAAQFVAGIDDILEVQLDPSADSIEANGVAIASETMHRILSKGAVALLLIEPELLGQPEWRSTSKELVRYYYAQDDTSKRIDFFRSAIQTEPELNVRQQQLGLFGARSSEFAPRDERILKVLDLIAERGNVSLSMSASRVDLSPSRLRHLFRELVGVPYKKYILWARVKNAVRHCLDGSTLTSAAHRTGFSDSAHFSKSFSNLFGLNPSTILQAGSRIHLLP